jgi:hypothetical protein
MELAINIDLMSMMSAVGHTPSCNGENSAGSAVRWANRYCGLARWARRSHDLPTRTNHAKRLCPPYVHCNGENSAGRKTSACWARS